MWFCTNFTFPVTALIRTLRGILLLCTHSHDEDTTSMARKITYWVSTVLVAVPSFFAAFAYLSGSSQAVQGFAHVGYPQQLRIILGIAKFLGAITLIVPGLPKLKEWAYAGFTFAWSSAFVAHYLAKDGPKAFTPLILLVVLFVSYVTGPTSPRAR